MIQIQINITEIIDDSRTVTLEIKPLVELHKGWTELETIHAARILEVMTRISRMKTDEFEKLIKTGEPA